jgi:hypothetical protein
MICGLGVLLETSHGLLLLGMVIMSLSIISKIIFTCGDDDNFSRPHKRKDGDDGRYFNYIGYYSTMDVETVEVELVAVATAILKKNEMIH